MWIRENTCEIKPEGADQAEQTVSLEPILFTKHDACTVQLRGADLSTFWPSYPQEDGYSYSLHLSGSFVSDTAGNPSTDTFQNTIILADTVAPKAVVEDFVPAQDQLSVPLDSNVQLVFDEVIRIGLAGKVTLTPEWVREDACEVMPVIDAPIVIDATSSELSISACTLTIDPSVLFDDDGIRYHVTVDASVIEDNGQDAPPALDGDGNTI